MTLKLKFTKLKRKLVRFGRLMAQFQTKKSLSIAPYLSAGSGNDLAELKQGAAAGNEWDEHKTAITKEFHAHPMNFLRQSIISQTLHPMNQQEMARLQLDEMRHYSFCCEEIFPILNDAPIGDPYLCHYFPLASSLSIQHAYHHFMMKKHFGVSVTEMNKNEGEYILEFGGGYGNFCRLTYNFGYSGRYIIVDLPELQVLQRHFIQRVLPQPMSQQSIEFHDSINPNMLPKQGGMLFMGTYSLGETPLATRREIEKYYALFDYIFLAYGKSFGSVDNLNYFDKLKSRLKDDFQIQIIPNKHETDCYYLLGQRRVGKLL